MFLNLVSPDVKVQRSNRNTAESSGELSLKVINVKKIYSFSLKINRNEIKEPTWLFHKPAGMTILNKIHKFQTFLSHNWLFSLNRQYFQRIEINFSLFLQKAPVGAKCCVGQPSQWGRLWLRFPESPHLSSRLRILGSLGFECIGKPSNWDKLIFLCSEIKTLDRDVTPHCQNMSCTACRQQEGNINKFLPF